MAGMSLNGAYNHFIQDYVSKDVANADSHRKDELRDVYRSIAKINKNSPLYLLTDDDTSRNDAIGIKERARQLQGNIIGLNNQDDKSSLDHSAGFTTNEEKVTAIYIGTTPEEDIKNTSFNINVFSLATAQVNTGNFLSPGHNTLPADNYAFDVRINHQEYEFQFSIYNTDSNKDLQQRIEKLINKASIGLSASIIHDSSGRNALEITSTKTGIKSGDTCQFKIYESSGSLAKGAVSYLGLDHISSNASNSHFALNGEEKNAFSNRFTVGGKFELQLLNVTAPDETITVGVKKDNAALKRHITSLIDNYNSFVTETSGERDPKFKSEKLKYEIVSIAKKYMTSLEDAGIALESDGTIAIDDELLSQAISGAESSEALSPVKKFAGALIAKTKEISVDPMKYVERPVVNYKNPDSNEGAEPYVTSEYSGMMFNNYC